MKMVRYRFPLTRGTSSDGSGAAKGEASDKGAASASDKGDDGKKTGGGDDGADGRTSVAASGKKKNPGAAAKKKNDASADRYLTLLALSKQKRRERPLARYRYPFVLLLRAGFLSFPLLSFSAPVDSPFLSVPAPVVSFPPLLTGTGAAEKQSVSDRYSSFLTSTSPRSGEEALQALVTGALTPRALAAGNTVTDQGGRRTCIGHALAAAIGEAENRIGRNFDFERLQRPLAEAIGCGQQVSRNDHVDVLVAFLAADGGPQSREKIYEDAAGRVGTSVDEPIDRSVELAGDFFMRNAVALPAGEFFTRYRLPFVYSQSFYRSMSPKNSAAPHCSPPASIRGWKWSFPFRAGEFTLPAYLSRADPRPPAVYRLVLGYEHEWDLFQKNLQPREGERELTDRAGDAFVLTPEEWSRMLTAVESSKMTTRREPDDDASVSGPGGGEDHEHDADHGRPQRAKDAAHLMYIEGVGTATGSGRATSTGRREQIIRYVKFKNSWGTGWGRSIGLNHDPGRIRVDVRLLLDWERQYYRPWNDIMHVSGKPFSVHALVFDPALATSECKAFYQTWERLQREAVTAVERTAPGRFHAAVGELEKERNARRAEEVRLRAELSAAQAKLQDEVHEMRVLHDEVHEVGDKLESSEALARSELHEVRHELVSSQSKNAGLKTEMELSAQQREQYSVSEQNSQELLRRRLAESERSEAAGRTELGELREEVAALKRAGIGIGKEVQGRREENDETRPRAAAEKVKGGGGNILEFEEPQVRRESDDSSAMASEVHGDEVHDGAKFMDTIRRRRAKFMEVRHDNDALKKDNAALKKDHEALKKELDALRRKLRRGEEEAQLMAELTPLDGILLPSPRVPRGSEEGSTSSRKKTVEELRKAKELEALVSQAELLNELRTARELEVVATVEKEKSKLHELNEAKDMEIVALRAELSELKNEASELKRTTASTSVRSFEHPRQHQDPVEPRQGDPVEPRREEQGLLLVAQQATSSDQGVLQSAQLVRQRAELSQRTGQQLTDWLMIEALREQLTEQTQANEALQEELKEQKQATAAVLAKNAAIAAMLSGHLKEFSSSLSTWTEGGQRSEAALRAKVDTLEDKLALMSEANNPVLASTLRELREQAHLWRLNELTKRSERQRSDAATQTPGTELRALDEEPHESAPGTAGQGAQDRRGAAFAERARIAHEMVAELEKMERERQEVVAAAGGRGDRDVMRTELDALRVRNELLERASNFALGMESQSTQRDEQAQRRMEVERLTESEKSEAATQTEPQALEQDPHEGELRAGGALVQELLTDEVRRLQEPLAELQQQASEDNVLQEERSAERTGGVVMRTEAELEEAAMRTELAQELRDRLYVLEARNSALESTLADIVPELVKAGASVGTSSVLRDAALLVAALLGGSVARQGDDAESVTPPQADPYEEGSPAERVIAHSDLPPHVVDFLRADRDDSGVGEHRLRIRVALAFLRASSRTFFKAIEPVDDEAKLRFLHTRWEGLRALRGSGSDVLFEYPPNGPAQRVTTFDYTGSRRQLIVGLFQETIKAARAFSPEVFRNQYDSLEGFWARIADQAWEYMNLPKLVKVARTTTPGTTGGPLYDSHWQRRSKVTASRDAMALYQVFPEELKVAFADRAWSAGEEFKGVPGQSQAQFIWREVFAHLPRDFQKQRAVQMWRKLAGVDRGGEGGPNPPPDGDGSADQFHSLLDLLGDDFDLQADVDASTLTESDAFSYEAGEDFFQGIYFRSITGLSDNDARAALETVSKIDPEPDVLVRFARSLPDDLQHVLLSHQREWALLCERQLTPLDCVRWGWERLTERASLVPLDRSFVAVSGSLALQVRTEFVRRLFRESPSLARRRDNAEAAWAYSTMLLASRSRDESSGTAPFLDVQQSCITESELAEEVERIFRVFHEAGLGEQFAERAWRLTEAGAAEQRMRTLRPDREKILSRPAAEGAYRLFKLFPRVFQRQKAAVFFKMLAHRTCPRMMAKEGRKRNYYEAKNTLNEEFSFLLQRVFEDVDEEGDVGLSSGGVSRAADEDHHEERQAITSNDVVAALGLDLPSPCEPGWSSSPALVYLKSAEEVVPVLGTERTAGAQSHSQDEEEQEQEHLRDSNSETTTTPSREEDQDQVRNYFAMQRYVFGIAAARPAPVGSTPVRYDLDRPDEPPRGLVQKWEAASAMLRTECFVLGFGVFEVLEKGGYDALPAGLKTRFADRAWRVVKNGIFDQNAPASDSSSAGEYFYSFWKYLEGGQNLKWQTAAELFKLLAYGARKRTRSEVEGDVEQPVPSSNPEDFEQLGRTAGKVEQFADIFAFLLTRGGTSRSSEGLDDVEEQGRPRGLVAGITFQDALAALHIGDGATKHRDNDKLLSTETPRRTTAA